MSKIQKIVLSLGSNVGDREKCIDRALIALSDSGFNIIKTSSLYETEPVNYREQDQFLNLAVSGNFDGNPEDLLINILNIEEQLGRKRVIKYGPRTIDIDIIFFGDEIMKTSDLVIPHCEFRRRKFVLEPAAEIEPEIIDPESGKTISELLTECLDRSEVIKQEFAANEI